MNIMEEIRTQLAIYCDDHLDVEREENICTIEMWDCEYSCDPLTDDIKLILDDIKEFDIKISSIYIEKYEQYKELNGKQKKARVKLKNLIFFHFFRVLERIFSGSVTFYSYLFTNPARYGMMKTRNIR